MILSQNRILSGKNHNFNWHMALGIVMGMCIMSAPVQAQKLEEVIVTAQKREQSLQDVSVAVTAVSGDRLQEAKIDSLEDLQAIVPSITFGNDFNVAKTYVRGIGTNTSVPGSDPGVAMYVDGAVLSRPGEQFTSFFDLDRVEVIRGPAGTLFGRNAVGGAINLITAKPTEELEGYVHVSAGNYDYIGADGAIGGPITDWILGRVAVKVDRRNGFGENPFTGSDIDDLDKRMARAHLQFNFTADIDLLLTGEYYKRDDKSGAIHFKDANFPGDPLRLPTGLAQPGVLPGGHAADPRDYASEFDPANVQETWALTGTFNWRLNDTFSIKNILNYREYDNQLLQDLDMSSIVNSLATTGNSTTIQNRNVFSEHWSEELQLHYSSERLNGVVGFFYFKDNFGSFPNTIGLTPNGGQNANGLPSGARPRFDGNSNLGAEAYAIFGQFTYDVTDQIALKLGARYSDEDRTQHNMGIILGGGGALGPVVNLNDYKKENFSDFSPEVGIEWRPTEQLMLYAVYSEGFKAGAGQASITAADIVDPEQIENYEFGLKSSWFNQTLQVNLAGYFYTLEGLQISRTRPNPVGGFVTVFENAAITKAHGVELDARWQPVEQFQLDASVSYLNSEFDEFSSRDPLDPVNLNPATAVLVDLAGKATRYSPEWTYNIHATYDWPLANGGMVTFAGDVSYKDDQFHTEFNDPRMMTDSYILLDGDIKYTFPNAQWTADFWVKNLTDEDVEAGSFAVSTSLSIGRVWLPPRTFGATLGYSF